MNHEWDGHLPFIPWSRPSCLDRLLINGRRTIHRHRLGSKGAPPHYFEENIDFFKQFFRLYCLKISPNLGYIFTPRPSYFKVLDPPLTHIYIEILTIYWRVFDICGNDSSYRADLIPVQLITLSLQLWASFTNTAFFSCSNMRALICDYLLDNARNQHEFLIRNRQDSQLQFYTKQNNLRSWAHGQVCLEQAKVAIAIGPGVSRKWWKTKVPSPRV
jgi:hypothetical protein